MNKKILAVAVAAAFVAPLAAHAEATLYGQGHLSLDVMDGVAGGVDASNYGVRSRASRIGVKGAEDLGGGLKAVYQMEWQVDMAGDNNNTGALGDKVSGANNLLARNQIVGLSGSWGTVALGRHDTPMKMSTAKLDIFSDTLADYNNIILNDRRGNDVVAYLSPSLSGFNVNVAMITAESNSPAAATGFKDDPAAVSLGATYENGPLFLAFGYENIGDMTNDVDSEDTATDMRFGAGYKMGDFGVGFVYHNEEGNGADVANAWLLNGSYTMGNNVLKAEYGVRDPDAAGADDQSMWAVGVDHNFSKSTTVYALYAATDKNPRALQDSYAGPDANGELTGLSLGIIKKF